MLFKKYIIKNMLQNLFFTKNYIINQPYNFSNIKKVILRYNLIKTKGVPVKISEYLHWNAFISSNKLPGLFTSYFSLGLTQWLPKLPGPICPMQ